MSLKPKIVLYHARTRPISIAGIIVFGYLFMSDFLQLQESFCSIGFAQPGLSDACGAIGLGNKPTREERFAWEGIDNTNCAALRDHIDRFPNGAYRSTAADRLTARWIQYSSTNKDRQPIRLPIYVGHESEAMHDLAAAQNEAFNIATEQSKKQCEGLSASSAYTTQNVTVDVDQWDCQNYSSGIVCGLSGWASCQVTQTSTTEVERCGPQG